MTFTFVIDLISQNYIITSCFCCFTVFVYVQCKCVLTSDWICNSVCVCVCVACVNCLVSVVLALVFVLCTTTDCETVQLVDPCVCSWINVHEVQSKLTFDHEHFWHVLRVWHMSQSQHIFAVVVQCIRIELTFDNLLSYFIVCLLQCTYLIIWLWDIHKLNNYSWNSIISPNKISFISLLCRWTTGTCICIIWNAWMYCTCEFLLCALTCSWSLVVNASISCSNLLWHVLCCHWKYKKSSETYHQLQV